MGTVVPFTPHRPPPGMMAAEDRAEIARLQGTAIMLGYSRLEIVDPHPGQEVGTFVTAYRGAEEFARWGFHREDGEVRAWDARNWADVGRFQSFADALLTVLPMPYE